MHTIPRPHSSNVRSWVLSALAACVGLTQTAQAITHPGILHTQADLDRMVSKVNANAQPWLGGWNKLIANSHAQTGYTPNPQASVCCGAGGCPNGETFMPLANDCAAAYQCALRYRISGDTAYANKARDIMNAWSATLTTITGDSNADLRAGLYGYQFAAAAELMRSYSGWAAADFTRFKNMMLNVFYPHSNSFLTTHRGTCFDHYWANWDVSNMTSILAIGVLCDQQTKIDQAINYFYTGVGTGKYDRMCNFVYAGSPQLGQCQESGRDQGHATLVMALAGAFAQIAYCQGTDLFAYSNNRLQAMFEYTAKYNLNQSVPWTNYTNCENTAMTAVSATGRGTIRPCWELVYNHYANLKGLAVPSSQQWAANVRPEGGGGDYGSTSGGFDQLGFGTLTFTRDPGVAAPVITSATTASGTVGAVFTYTITATNSPTSYGATGLPAGLTVNTSTGVIAGTPTAAGTSSVTISATNAGGTDTATLTLTINASGALPSPWVQADVGTVGTAGSGTYAGSTFTVKGAGSDIGGTADSFHYVYQTLTGDGSLVVRLATETQGGTANDKVGIMIRESTANNSTMVGVILDSSSSTVRLVSRASTGGSAVWVNGSTGVSAPRWFKLVRATNSFTGFVSTDGVTWTAVGTAVSVTMASNVTMGMAVCSRDTASLNTSTFDNATAAP